MDFLVLIKESINSYFFLQIARRSKDLIRLYKYNSSVLNKDCKGKAISCKTRVIIPRLLALSGMRYLPACHNP